MERNWDPFDCGGQSLSRTEKITRTIETVLTLALFIGATKSAIDIVRDAWVKNQINSQG